MREKWTAMFLREIINIQTKRIPKDLRWPYFQLPVFIRLNIYRPRINADLEQTPHPIRTMRRLFEDNKKNLGTTW